MAAPMMRRLLPNFQRISRLKQELRLVQPVRGTQTVPWYVRELQRKSDLNKDREAADPSDFTEVNVSQDFREMYPEFLPSSEPHHSRDRILLKLEHHDMMRRRGVIEIPEFYVGSVVAVTVADSNAPGKTNRFVGLCIYKGGHGLRADFILRNCIEGEGIEIMYHMYNPTLQSIQCLKLEKRLDNELIYLRDAPLEYSTVPFNMDPVPHPKGAPVPVNDIVVPLKEGKWRHRWYNRHDLKGVSFTLDQLKEPEKRFMAMHDKPWEEFDLMKEYRETGSEQLKQDIYKNVYLEQQTIDEGKSRDRQIMAAQAKAKARVKRTKRAPVAGVVAPRDT